MNNDHLTNVFTRLRYKLRMAGSAILRNPDDVEDAIQDTFCKVWNSRDDIETESHATALSITTLRNTCIDAVRKSGTEVAVLDRDGQTDCCEEVLDEADDAYTVVRKIIDTSLTDVQRRIITMRDIDGLPYAEIARIMNMEEATVRVNLSRARKTVRDIYRKSNTL